MKKFLAMMVCALSVISFSHARPYFNKTKDILLAQFDSKPDPDDIHAIAALGCMLAHDEFKNVNYLAVAGAYGYQGGKYINAPALFNAAFGAKNVKWVDAHNNRSGSVTFIKNKVKPILNNGGKVWVQEAGQSDITADWIKALLNAGVSASTVKNNVIVIQHSKWNEDHTTSGDLSYVKNKAKYQAVSDGNGTNNSRGPATPSYRTKTKSFFKATKTSPNAKAKSLWKEADRVILANGHLPSHSSITVGGVDFSDCVENWWIFNVSNAASVAAFWTKFVTNTPTAGGSTGSFVGKTIAIKAFGNGKFVCADKTLNPANAGLVANRTSAGGWEKFKVVDAGSGLIALKASANGKFVVVNTALGSKLTATGASISATAKFKFIKNADGSYSIKANSNSKFVCADRSLNSTHWPLAANRSTAGGAWEKFTIQVK